MNFVSMCFQQRLDRLAASHISVGTEFMSSSILKTSQKKDGRPGIHFTTHSILLVLPQQQLPPVSTDSTLWICMKFICMIPLLFGMESWSLSWSAGFFRIISLFGLNEVTKECVRNQLRNVLQHLPLLVGQNDVLTKFRLNNSLPTCR